MVLNSIPGTRLKGLFEDTYNSFEKKINVRNWISFLPNDEGKLEILCDSKSFQGILCVYVVNCIFLWIL